MTMDPISQEIIEALLSGKAPAGGLPEELAKVKALVDRANAPASYSETTGAHQVIQAFRAAQGGAIPTGGKGKVLSKLLTAKAAAVAAAIALTGGAAAALTGVVPVSFNSHAHQTPSVSLVTTNDSGSSNAPHTTATTTFAGESQGMASGANIFGECTAYMAITGHAPTSVVGSGSSNPSTGPLASTNFQNLAKYVAGQTVPGYSATGGIASQSEIIAFCKTVIGTHTTGSANANANANANATSKGQSGKHNSGSGGSSNGVQGGASVSGSAVVGTTPPVTGPPTSAPPVSTPVSIPSHPGK